MFAALRHRSFPLFTRGPIKRCCSGDTRGERTNQTTVPEIFPLPELPSEPPLMETRLMSDLALTLTKACQDGELAEQTLLLA